MKLTLKKLIELDACEEGLDWYTEQNTTDVFKILDELIKQKHLDWANWLLPSMMTYKQYVSYAVYAAEQVIDIYEAKYPDDKRPRLAIEAAKKCIKNPTEENKIAVDDAADFAAAADASLAAAYAADAAADASASYASYAADAAFDATDAEKVQFKIINYGIKLLKGEIK
jgi:hypothetical protein